MKNILCLFAITILALLTSCDLIKKKTDGKSDSSSTEQTDTITGDDIGDTTDEPTTPVPDNDVAKKIIAKYNQGPAINNKDYADALEYAEIYLSLTAYNLAAMMSDDTAQRSEAESAISEIEKEYPYNAELIQILYQASALEKTAGGLVVMNDDNRARFDALVQRYDSIGK